MSRQEISNLSLDVISTFSVEENAHLSHLLDFNDYVDRQNHTALITSLSHRRDGLGYLSLSKV